MLKALSWLARIGQIKSLASLLSNPLAGAFASPQQPQERKEALPLPLAILASWERKVCAADCTHNLRITLGSFLLAAHTSMRFGDIQRIKIKEISLTQHALRGSCWATKTTKVGQPLFGLTGQGVQSSWVIKWLESLSEAVTQSISEPCNLPEPDFLMPVFACMDNNTHPKFSGPLPHTQALSLLRWAAQVPWEPRTSACFNSDEAQGYTLHSLKVALLSASAQLRLPEESRRQQGHHRINSVQLYSSRESAYPVFKPLFRVDAHPLQKVCICRTCPHLSARSPTQENSKLSPAWQTQKHGRCRTFSPQTAPTHQNQARREAPLQQSSSALCLVQVTTGAAARAVHSSPHHLQTAFCTACGLGIQAPVRRIDYLGQEYLCKHKSQAVTLTTRPLPRSAGPHLSRLQPCLDPLASHA